VDLSLEGNRPAHLFECLDGFGSRLYDHAVWDGGPGGGEQFLGLVFMDFHQEVPD
jgi:hypothetical protein